METTEEKILSLIKQGPQTISSLSKKLNLDYKNAWRYVRRLYDKEIIDLKPRPEESQKGKPVYVLLRMNSNDKEKEYIYKILNEIKNKKELTLKDFSTLFPSDDFYENNIILGAILKLPYTDLVERYIRITPEGLKFLDQHKEVNNS